MLVVSIVCGIMSPSDVIHFKINLLSLWNQLKLDLIQHLLKSVIEDLYMICRGLVWVMKLSYDFNTCYVSLSLAFGVCICIDGKWRENI